MSPVQNDGNPVQTPWQTLRSEECSSARKMIVIDLRCAEWKVRVGKRATKCDFFGPGGVDHVIVSHSIGSRDSHSGFWILHFCRHTFHSFRRSATVVRGQSHTGNAGPPLCSSGKWQSAKWSTYARHRMDGTATGPRDPETRSPHHTTQHTSRACTY